MKIEPLDCAACGKDMLHISQCQLARWNSPTDKRLFCSTECIAKSEPPEDCHKIVPNADPLPNFSEDWVPLPWHGDNK